MFRLRNLSQHQILDFCLYFTRFIFCTCGRGLHIKAFCRKLWQYYWAVLLFHSICITPQILRDSSWVSYHNSYAWYIGTLVQCLKSVWHSPLRNTKPDICLVKKVLQLESTLYFVVLINVHIKKMGLSICYSLFVTYIRYGHSQPSSGLLMLPDPTPTKGTKAKVATVGTAL